MSCQKANSNRAGVNKDSTFDCWSEVNCIVAAGLQMQIPKTQEGSVMYKKLVCQRRERKREMFKGYLGGDGW